MHDWLWVPSLFELNSKIHHDVFVQNIINTCGKWHFAFSANLLYLTHHKTHHKTHQANIMVPFGKMNGKESFKTYQFKILMRDLLYSPTLNATIPAFS
jgi:hypothetical protein